MTMENTETQGAAVKPFKLAGWRPDAPMPLVLDDSRLLDYRHPAELRMLALAIAAIAILVGLAVWLRDNNALLAGVAVYRSMLITSIQFCNLQ